MPSSYSMKYVVNHYKILQTLMKLNFLFTDINDPDWNIYLSGEQTSYCTYTLRYTERGHNATVTFQLKREPTRSQSKLEHDQSVKFAALSYIKTKLML